MASLVERHIQDYEHAAGLEPHWGYVSRVLPCTNDAGSCEYLDQVYYGHDLSMVYTFIMWGVILGILFVWTAGRLVRRFAGSSRTTAAQAGENGVQKVGFLSRTTGTLGATTRKYLLKETWGTSLFGHVSRLQVLILAVISGYLIIFTFIGFTYKQWITPVKNSTEFNTRSTMGPWSDRIGAIAYALTPFAVALGTRESLLSLATGIPYQHFNFLHIWLGRIIYVQSALHTIAWTIIEAKLYRPQPMVWQMFIPQQYIIFGCFAMAFITFLFVFSFKSVIRLTGYEFFRKTHYVVAVLYIGSCWGHWYQLACWMIASFGIYGIDRGVRLLRTALIHFGKGDVGKIGFRPSQASVKVFEDAEASVVRLEFEQAHKPWTVGQHFHLCFPALTIWQSHPMTPASSPSSTGKQKHVYIIRALKGETARLAKLCQGEVKDVTTPVILTGPSGCKISPATNSLVVAGGTGISFALPVFEQALAQAEITGRGAVHLAWIIRESSNIDWVAEEIASLRSRIAKFSNIDAKIKIFVTRESRKSASTSSLSRSDGEAVELADEKGALTATARSMSQSSSVGYSVECLGGEHPNLIAHSRILEEWATASATYGGKTEVLASGPRGMGCDLRHAVAALNEPSLAWKGQGGNVGFYWDDRMG